MLIIKDISQAKVYIEYQINRLQKNNESIQGSNLSKKDKSLQTAYNNGAILAYEESIRVLDALSVNEILKSKY